MKRISRDFGQYINGSYEDVDLTEYFKDAYKLIGEIVVSFSGLESYINEILCRELNESSDRLGMIVMHQMPFSSKVGLFQRLSDSLHKSYDLEPSEYKRLVSRIKEAGHLRNLVVHAEWERTDTDGLTHVAVKIKNGSITQEYVQFSVESLTTINEKIHSARSNLDRYFEQLDELFSGNIT